jgi:hypothetical protein
MTGRDDDFKKPEAPIGIGAAHLHCLQHAEEPECFALVMRQSVPVHRAIYGCCRHQILLTIC